MDRNEVKIDLDHLARQTMDDTELQREVLQIFAEQMAMKRVQLSVHAQDLKGQAHSIKGSAKGVGAWGVAQAAQALESGEGDILPLLQELNLAIDEALLEIQSLLKA